MLDDSLMISLQIPLCTPIPTFAPQFWHCIINWGPLIIAYDSVTVSPLHPHSDICTPILTFGQTPQKRPILAPKKGKNGPKKRDIFRIHIGVDFLQKNRPKLLKICPCGAIYILHQLIWGRHPVPCLSTQISKRQGTAMYYQSPNGNIYVEGRT